MTDDSLTPQSAGTVYGVARVPDQPTASVGAQRRDHEFDDESIRRAVQSSTIEIRSLRSA